MGGITKEDILKIRKLYDLSQYDMAHILQMTQPAVFQIEKGYIAISDKTADKLITHFNLTPERLAFIRGVYAEFESGRQAIL